MSEAIMLMGLFQKSTDTADAIDAVHKLGIPDENVTVITGIPYPEQALGRQHHWIRLPYIVLGGALTGLAIGLFLSVVTPNLYPLNVGGHPLSGGPPAAVITYVFTMMATIVATFLGVLWEMGVPSFEKKIYDKRVTSGYLAVLLRDVPEELETAVTDTLEAHKGEDIHRPERMIL
ncbi:MAG: DUF3341 domain-containing protein [Chloroflexi bacterium]|nr:DUF3341 domain-containing protein [Chloroflexota bacterium]